MPMQKAIGDTMEKQRSCQRARSTYCSAMNGVEKIKVRNMALPPALRAFLKKALKRNESKISVTPNDKIRNQSTSTEEDLAS